jgi:hypothetical protein
MDDDMKKLSKEENESIENSQLKIESIKDKYNSFYEEEELQIQQNVSVYSPNSQNFAINSGSSPYEIGGSSISQPSGDEDLM